MDKKVCNNKTKKIVDKYWQENVKKWYKSHQFLQIALIYCIQKQTSQNN